MIVITGATGHIGNVLVRELLARGKQLRLVIPRFEDSTPVEGLPAERVEGDLCDPDSLVDAFKGAEAVYHLAAVVSIMPGERDLLHRVNVVGTRNVVRACRECRVPRLVYTSTIHAIVEPPQGTAIDESWPFDPERVVGDYAKSKAEATLEVLDAVKAGLDAVIVCPTGVLGPYDFRPSEMGQLFLDFAGKKVKGGIEGGYDFADVRDVAIGHILACDSGRMGEVYILSGEWIAVSDIMLLLEEYTGVRAPRGKAPIWLALIGAVFSPLYYKLTRTKPIFTEYSIRTLASNAQVSCEKARRELGFSPRPLRESVADAVQWFKDAGRL